MTDGKLPPRRISAAPLDPPPCLRPARTVLHGTTACLEPLDPRLHGAELYAAGHTGEQALHIWDYLSYGPFADQAAFSAWLRDGAASADPLFYAVRDLQSGRAGGMLSFLNIAPKQGSIEIGHIWLAPFLQNSRPGTEALYLVMAEAFDQLGYRRLEWKCNALNEASRRAAARLGFAFEGVFYQHMISRGRNRDTAWFSLLDYEWPAVRTNFQRWLEPANFDEAGRPRLSLGALNYALREEG